MDKNKKLFPQRLWELIHDEKYSFCLRWSQDGQRVYLNRNEFETHYLKTPNNQFHTQKAISFVRQMNMYGFRKVDDCFYENDNFKRNCPHLLKNMIRKHSNRGYFSSPPSSVGPSHHLHTNSHHPPYPPLAHHLSHHQVPLPPFSQHPASATLQSSIAPLPAAEHPIQQMTHNQEATKPALLNQVEVRRLHEHLHSQHQQQDSTLVTSLQHQHQNQNQNRHQHQQRQDTPPDTSSQQSSFETADVARSINNLRAALTSQTPLASSLYYRLAALNFNSNSQQRTSGQQLASAAEQHQLISQLMQLRQLATTNNPNSLLAPPTNNTCFEQSEVNQRISALQHSQQASQLTNRQFSQETSNLVNFLVDSASGSAGQLSEAEQVASLQENLVRSFLQLHSRHSQQQQTEFHSNQLPQQIQDKSFLLRSLQSENLLQSLAATMSSGEPPPQVSSPLELVVKKR